MSEPEPYGRRKYDKSVGKFNCHTKIIALPGGKIVQVMYFSEPQTEKVTFRDCEWLDLHICPRCGSDLVYPTSWEERQNDLWRVERRCPNCEWTHTGEFLQDEVEMFDDVLNEGTEEALVVLRDFARQNMEEDVERLIEAIRKDLIQPMDF